MHVRWKFAHVVSAHETKISKPAPRRDNYWDDFNEQALTNSRQDGRNGDGMMQENRPTHDRVELEGSRKES